MCLQFGFVIFCKKVFGTKAAHKMLVKLMPGGPMGTRDVLQILYGENHKIVNNSTTAEAREKISADLESSELQKNNVGFTKFKHYQILLNRIIHLFRVLIKLFVW